MEKHVVIISGATSGIGLATLQGLCEDGYTVVGFGRSAEKIAAVLPGLREQFGSDAVELHALDVRDVEAVQAFVSDVHARHHRIDGLVNAAGVMRVERSHTVSEASFDLQVDTLLKGTFFLTTAVLPFMIEQDGGLIINIGSLSGLRAAPKMAVYGAAKAAINNLTQSLAAEYADNGIRAICINPGVVDTPLMDTLLLATIQKRVPLKRLASPQEIAYLVRFLFSSDASYVTGAAVTIDGGLGL